MNKSTADVRINEQSSMQVLCEVLCGVPGLIWEILALVFPRLRRDQITLARFVKLDGVWESAPRKKPLPMKRHRQFLRVDALDGRQKFGHHPEGEALRLIRIEGITTNGKVIALEWSGGTNSCANFSLPIEARETSLATIRIKSDLGIPVSVRWMCDDFVK